MLYRERRLRAEVRMAEKWFCLALGDGVLTALVVAEFDALQLPTGKGPFSPALFLHYSQQGRIASCDFSSHQTLRLWLRSMLRSLVQGQRRRVCSC